MKYIKQILMVTAVWLMSLSTFANDANSIPDDYIFTPSIDTQAYRAEQNAANAVGTATTAFNMVDSAMRTADSAERTANETKATLMNKNGCVYNPHLDCTEDNLANDYKTTFHNESWETPGNYLWRVPTGVTSLNAEVMSGGPGGTYPYKCLKHDANGKPIQKTCYVNGHSGESSSITIQGRTTTSPRDKIANIKANVGAGNIINFVIGKGGRGAYTGQKNPYKPSGVNGFIKISYVKNIKI